MFLFVVLCNLTIFKCVKTFVGTKHLENQIYAEIRGRIKEDDISVPLRKGPYYYYQRTLEGKEYVQYCRRLVPNVEVPPSVYETMPTGPSAPPEHVILDENIKAQEHAYYSIGAFKVRKFSFFGVQILWFFLSGNVLLLNVYVHIHFVFRSVQIVSW